MNKRLALIPVTGFVLFSLAGCATTNHETNATHTQTATSASNAVGGGGTAGAGNQTTAGNTGSVSTGNTVTIGAADSTPSPSSTYAKEIALMKKKGYSANERTPSATVTSTSGDQVTAWLTTATQSQDGYNHFVFFFVNGQFIGTDTAKPSLEITRVAASGNGIAVTYPVYKANDAYADPTGTPVTITYTWTGSKLVPNKPYPSQFQATSSTSHGRNPISTRSFANATAAANEIASIQGGQLSGLPVNLGDGITAKESAGMGHARYEWQEGNWAIEVRYYTMNSGAKQIAENIVSYLHTHMLPAPKEHGIIIVSSTDTNSAFDPKTTIAWQEGSDVKQLQQTGNPIQALQTVVNDK